MLPVRRLPPGDLRVRTRCHNFFPGRERPQAGAHHRTPSGRIPPPVNQSTPTQTFRAIDVIRKKRDGIELSRGEIEGLVGAYTKGDIPDYRVSAWLMAVVLKGM